MIDLVETLVGWLGPLGPDPSLCARSGARGGGAGEDTTPRRVLLLGSGFTKSAWEGAPVFRAFRPLLQERLARAGTVPATLQPLIGDHGGEETGYPARSRCPRSSAPPEIDPAELIQMVDQYLGRVAVARTILAEPQGASPRLLPPQDPVRRPLPPRGDSAFRSFKLWCQAIESHQPTHLAPLHPTGPVALLGRLIAEGVVETILSTNWDAYVELACALAGLRVCDADDRDHAKPTWLEELGGRLQVFESPGEATLHPRPRHGAVLLKLHGGVRTLHRLLAGLDHGDLSHQQAERELRRCFLVSSEDLVHWREPSDWVREAVGDALRASSLLALGLSGADPVIFRALRQRICEWEKEENDAETAAPRRRPPPFAAIDRSPQLRLTNMMAVRGRGLPEHRVVQAGGSVALRAAYAWWLVGRLAGALAVRSGREEEVRTALLDTLLAEIRQLAQDESLYTPLLDLLCGSLGPGARWAALAERRPPFHASVVSPLRRWWYAPWGRLRRSGEACPANLEEIAGFAAAVACTAPRTEGPAGVTVDPWTGVVHLGPRHRLLEDGVVSGSGANLLPLPWPWPVGRGLASSDLRSELRDRFTWGPGRSLESLARSPLWLVPLPAQGPERDDRAEVLTVGSVEGSVLRPAQFREPSSTWLAAAAGMLR